LKRVVFAGEIVATYWLPNALSGSSGEVGTMRCGNWNVPEEISVGQEAEVEEAEAVVDVGVGEAEVELGRPIASEPQNEFVSTVFNVTV